MLHCAAWNGPSRCNKLAMKHYYSGGGNASFFGKCEMDRRARFTIFVLLRLAHQLVVSMINYKYKRSHTQMKKNTALQYAWLSGRKKIFFGLKGTFPRGYLSVYRNGRSQVNKKSSASLIAVPPLLIWIYTKTTEVRPFNNKVYSIDAKLHP